MAQNYTPKYSAEGVARLVASVFSRSIDFSPDPSHNRFGPYKYGQDKDALTFYSRELEDHDPKYVDMTVDMALSVILANTNRKPEVNARRREVLIRRYGLITGKKETIGSITTVYKRSIERIRLDEKQALSAVKESGVLEELFWWLPNRSCDYPAIRRTQPAWSASWAAVKA